MAVRHYVAHIAFDGRDPFQRLTAARIHYQTAGENLGEASGYSPLRAAQVLDPELEAMLRVAARGLRAAVSEATAAVYRARIDALDARLV